jgi:hypothetical protein
MGKDHWPENSWLLLGRGVRSGTVGGTDGHLRGTPVDYRSGLSARDGRPIFIDNVYATLAALAGANPTQLGYPGDSVVAAILKAPPR